MRVNALGPVEVLSTAGVEVNLGGAKPKTLLAALAMEPRRIMSIERLVHLVWDEAPPQSAVALIHTYVSTLRRGFAAAGEQQVLVTRAPGYVLNVEPDNLDFEVFGRHLRNARLAEHEQDHATAARHYQQALRLWRGPAFSGVDSQFARTYAAALEGERLSAEEGLARCWLAVDQIGEAVARLTALSAAYPMREEIRGLLMRALYLSGRQADAMAVYRDGREQMIAELGVEPSAQLQELHAQMLAGAIPVAARTVDVLPRQAPNLLPPDIADFTGRAEHIERVLAVARSDVTTPTVVVSAVSGAGKSALAVHCAHMLTADYPHGQLFADLQGLVEPADVLGRFLRALGVPGVELPDDLSERAELYRMKVADRRLIIVLDNARGEHQVRPLLPGAGRCLVIITSRSRLAGLAGADVVELELLSANQSMDMLTRILGAARIAGDPDAGRTIATLCGGVPLAIRVAGAKLVARGHWPLRALATRLSDERRRLDELAAGDLAIRSSLGLSYAELGDLQRRAFHLLALLGLPDFGSWLGAPLLEVSLDTAEDVVEQLVELRLVEVAGIDTLGRVRYRLHDLVRLFGAEQARQHEPAELVSAAIGRALATWTTLVEAGAARLPRVTLGLRPACGTTVTVDPRLAAQVEAAPTDWLTSETASLIRIIERSHELGIEELSTTLLTSLLSSPFAARNEFDGWQRTHDAALTAARQAGNRQDEAMLLAGLGQLYYEKDEFAAALDHFQQALEHASAIGDEAIQAIALVGLGTVRRDLAEFGVAAADLAAAAEVAERTGDQAVLAAANYGLGAIHRDHGDLGTAGDVLTACVELYHALGDLRGEALAIRGLSLCSRATGDHHAAAEQSRRAWQILDRAGDVLGATYARQSLAKADIRGGRLAGVRESLEACFEVCAGHNDRFGMALVRRTQGEHALATGDSAGARGLLTDALNRWSTLGLPLWEARTMRDLAAAWVHADPEHATELWEQALRRFGETGGREVGELAGSGPADWFEHVVKDL